jgi:AraC-like DNA-binding protein
MTIQREIDGWLGFHPDAAHQRDEYLGKRLQLPELSILGWTHFSRAMVHAQEADAHNGEYEIHYLVGGELDWWVEDKRYQFKAGQVMITRPGEMHGAKNGVLQPSELFWLRFKDPGKSTLTGFAPDEWRWLRGELGRLPIHVARVSDNVRRCFQQLIAEHRQPNNSSSAMCRALLHELLLWALRGWNERGDDHRDGGEPLTFAIRKAVRIIHDTPPDDKPLSVNALAGQVGLSESAFRRRFESDMGVSPNAYIKRRRIEKAGHLLSGGRSVTDVAFSLGFPSSQHFATAFKKVTGFSPTEYTAANR